MAECVIVDTDILIDVELGLIDASNCLKQIQEHSSMAISTITQMELMVGCRNKTELHQLDKFLDNFTIINLNEACNQKAVNLIRKYRLSHGPLIPDALIAATALIMDYPFVTKNQKDYRFIAGLNLIPYTSPLVIP